MGRRELLRWIASVGIFYVLIPAWVVLSGSIYRVILPWLPDPDVPLGVRIVGCLLAVLGAALAALSIRAIVRVGAGHPFDLTGRERLSRPTQYLVTTGVYRWSRNPMGLGDLMIYAGLALASNSMPSLLVHVPLYVVLVWWNHRFNERKRLLQQFGDDWENYERKTPWLVPGPGWILRHR